MSFYSKNSKLNETYRISKKYTKTISFWTRLRDKNIAKSNKGLKRESVTELRKQKGTRKHSKVGELSPQ